jgi:iron(III) transport system substrate-binding protein
MHEPTRRSLLVGALALGLPLPRAIGDAWAADLADVAAAKQESRVVIYTSAPMAAAQKFAEAFQAKYGIKVELFRTGGTQVLRRFLLEQQAGHNGADVLASSDTAAMIDLTAKGLFVPFKPEGFEKIPEAFRDPAGHYVPQRVSVISIYARADLIPAADMPKTWDDLLNPKYKGKIVITNPSFTSLQVSVVAMMSKLRGWGYFEQLAKNDVVVVQGNEQALNMLKTGERAIAAFADSQYANEARAAGHPLRVIFPAEGTFVLPAYTVAVKNSNNPNAAKLFAAYHLSLEAQRMWPASGVYAARSDVDPPAGSTPLKDIKVIPLDNAYILSVTPAVKKKFSELFSA